MASSVTISTPSPPGSVRTPATPKHGYSDSWEPFSPRKSARISAKQQSTNRTPSPRSSLQSTRPSTKSSFTTPAVSPIKKRLPKMDSVRRASGTLTAQGNAHAADSLGINNNKSQHKTQGPIAASRNSGELLTPAKTPCKHPNAKIEAASRAMARRLFVPDDQILATPKKRAKKYTGLTLDSFRAEDVEEDIQIFTDSRDHLPQLDDSAENPFYGDNFVAEPSKRRSKRKPVVVPGEGRCSVEDVVKRTDGVLVVFRGKKIFRKFSENVDDDSDSQAENDETADLDLNGEGPVRRRPMTRSSIKPRLLFPSKSKGKQVAATTIEDEEAVTDIEDNVFDHNTQDIETEIPATPIQFAKSKVKTPEAPRFAPASPPSTGRATRSADKLRGSDTPMRVTKPSPFDGWRRSKRQAGPQGTKREGDFLARSPAGTKRQRA